VKRRACREFESLRPRIGIAIAYVFREVFSVNISVTGDRLGAVYSGSDTSSVTSAGSAFSSTAAGNSGEDRLTVTDSTIKIQSTLSGLSASQASRISKLQSLYSSGRYDVSPARTASAMVSAAMVNADKL
jgi:hypothetical protein